MKSSRVFDYDRDTYDLDSLKLDLEVTEDRGSCITKSPGIASFKVLGKGGFGSIFVGTICKRTEPLFDGEPSFRHLGSTMVCYWQPHEAINRMSRLLL